MGRKAKVDFQVKRSAVPNAGKYWFIIGRPDGKRTRAWFDTKKEAQTEAQERNDIIHRFGQQAAVTLSGILAHMALECSARLKPYDKTINDATNFLLESLERAHSSISVQKLCDLVITEYSQRQQAGQVSAVHVKKFKEVIGPFAQHFGSRLIVTLSGAELYNWIAALKLSGGSKKSYRGYLSSIFRHARNTGLIDKNPVDDVAPFSEGKKPPIPILTVEQAEALLRNADPEIVAFFAVGLFAGPRRSEIERLGWEDIDFQAGLIDFSTEKTKTTFPRWLKISDNLRAWLLPVAKSSGPLWPAYRGRQLFDEAIAKSGADPWPNNGLRHSFISYHFAMHENLALTSSQAGHTNSTTTRKHYYRRVRQAEAEKYWAIYPS